MFPRTDGNLFSDASELYTPAASAVGRGDPRGLDRNDWIGFAGGIEYNARLVRNVELGVSVDGYTRTLDTSYRKYTRPNGSDILQTLKLSVVPLGVSVRLVPTGRRVRLGPYVAVGADLLFYQYEAFGDFIDFFDAQQPILPEAFRSDGVAPGFHVAAGLRVPLGHDVGLVGEYRYQWAKDDMDEDFSLNRIDLSGGGATLGFNIRF